MEPIQPRYCPYPYYQYQPYTAPNTPPEIPNVYISNYFIGNAHLDAALPPKPTQDIYSNTAKPDLQYANTAKADLQYTNIFSNTWPQDSSPTNHNVDQGSPEFKVDVWKNYSKEPVSRPPCSFTSPQQQLYPSTPPTRQQYPTTPPTRQQYPSPPPYSLHDPVKEPKFSPVLDTVRDSMKMERAQYTLPIMSETVKLEPVDPQYPLYQPYYSDMGPGQTQFDAMVEKTVLQQIQDLHVRGEYKEVMTLIASRAFPAIYHENLQSLWLSAVYGFAKHKRGKVPNAVDRYRLRKKWPFPATVWDGERTLYCYKESSREQLEKFFNKNRYPTPTEKKELSELCNLTYMQVCNWFKNKRMRGKDERS